MKQIDTKTLHKLQMIELEMLLEVDRICKKHSIPYNIIGGTLLGAVRHDGFIPWDDDADLIMLRADYDKFVSILKEELNHEKYYFQDAQCTDGYRWSYGKLRRKNTLFLREYQEHMNYEQGVFIDIFPVDNVPNNYFLRALHDAHCFCIRKIFWSEVGKIQDKKYIKRLWFRLLSKIPREKILNHYIKMIKKQNAKQSNYARIALMPLPNKGHGYLKEWFTESQDYCFEGKMLKGIKNYVDFLTFEFGNYQEIPPIEKQKIHPVSDISVFENDLYKEKYLCK